MIDAKTKAQELVENFGTLVEIHRWEGKNQDRQDVYSYDPRLSSANSKACALISVDEIIEALRVFYTGPDWGFKDTMGFQFWQKVKEHINTL